MGINRAAPHRDTLAPTIMTTELTPADIADQLVIPHAAPLTAAAAAADRAAARNLFDDYRDRQAQRTIEAHNDDLRRLALFLADAGRASAICPATGVWVPGWKVRRWNWQGRRP